MNWSYVAGFFDGEGSVTRNGNGYRVTIPQTHEGVLKEMRRFTGYGTVMKTTARQKHWKQSWTFFISRQSLVKHFLNHVQPYLLVKRELVDQVLPVVTKMTEQNQEKLKRVRFYKHEAARLRLRGLSYRGIGKRLGLDWGYVRRLTLSRTK